MKQTKKIALLFIGAIALQACYPGDSIPIEDLDTTSTFYTPDDFTTPHKSVAIFWEVAQIKNDDKDDLKYNGEVDDEILNTTLDNLVSIYGANNIIIISETPVPNPTPSNANVAIITGDDPAPNVEAVVASNIILRRETVGVVYPGYPWYGGWGGGWWGSGWGGCYYCGYPPTISYQQYDIGSVVLDMIDIRKFVGGQVPNEITPSWVAVNRGLISSNEVFNAERVENGINQAFIQSPYLDPKN